MIVAANFARTNKIPFLGICLGFQIAVIEFARNICGLKDAHSSELQPDTLTKVVIYMPEISKTHMGGTMRLGLRPTYFNKESEKWSKIRKLYANKATIWERHRHRYEINPEFVPTLEKAGLQFIGRNEASDRMQVLELKDHPYYVGMQAHPEFCTRPLNPSPPYLGLVAAAAGLLDQQIIEQKGYVPPHPESALHNKDPAIPTSNVTDGKA